MPGARKPKTAKPRKFDSPEQEGYLGLWRTYDLLRRLEDALFAPHGLSAQQYNLLRLLAAERPRSVPTLELASRLISRAPDITRMIDRLEQRGLVTRMRVAANRRVVEVAITRQGRALLSQLAEPVRHCHEAQLGHLDARELKSLVELLRVVRQPHESPESPWR